MKIFIYKLSDKNGKVYFGSTKDPKRRLRNHLSNHIMNKSCSSKKLNCLEWKMEILQEFNSLEDAREKEGQLISNNECVNINIPGGTKEEQNRRSWKKNQLKNYERIDCVCGGKYSIHHRWSHFRTSKHIKFMESLVNEDMFEVDGV